MEYLLYCNLQIKGILEENYHLCISFLFSIVFELDEPPIFDTPVPAFFGCDSWPALVVLFPMFFFRSSDFLPTLLAATAKLDSFYFVVLRCWL